MLAGDLREFTLEDLFQLLALTRKSGALRLTHGEAVGSVHFVEGEVAFALADQRRLPLGPRLVGAGCLSAERLEALVDEHRDSSAAALAAALLWADELTDEARTAFLVGQIHEALFQLARVEGGPFTFDADDVVADWPAPRLAASDALLETRRRLDEWKKLSPHLPADDAVLAISPNPPGEGAITLERQQWHLLALIDGQRSLSDLAELSGSDTFPTAKIASRLVEVGLVDKVQDGGALAQLLAGRAALRDFEEVALGASRRPTPDPHESAKRIAGLAEGSRGSFAVDPGVLRREAPGHRTGPTSGERHVGSDEPADVVATPDDAGSGDQSSPTGDDEPRFEQQEPPHEGDPAGGETGQANPGKADPDRAGTSSDAPDTARADDKPPRGGESSPTATANDDAVITGPPTYNRGQVARELASLGFGEEAAAKVQTRINALANGAPKREGETDAEVEAVRTLTHEEDVNRGLLLRLIDGIDGA